MYLMSYASGSGIARQKKIGKIYKFCDDFIHANSNASTRNYIVIDKMVISLVGSLRGTLGLSYQYIKISSRTKDK